LLRFLLQNAGKVSTHKFLLDELWNQPPSTALNQPHRYYRHFPMAASEAPRDC